MSFLQSEQKVEEIKKYVKTEFSSNIVPSLMDFVRIPNLSPEFDSEWKSNGLLHKAAEHLKSWILKQELKGVSVEIVQHPEQPPLLFVQVEATDTSDKTILFYGHYDKQPHFTGWKEGTHPTEPVIIDGKMYGRGCSDDGYSLYAAVMSIKACQNLGLPHPRCVITIEGEEESGSDYYMEYLESLKDQIKTPDFIFCIDSSCGNYECLWLTTSLRGNLKADVTVKVLNEGIHSGDGSGIVPSSFRIMRILLDRIEDSKTGTFHHSFNANIPPYRYEQAFQVSKEFGNEIFTKLPFANQTQPMSSDPLQAYLNNVWLPQLAVVGADGLPPCPIAGNVLLPETTLRLSIRLPPNLDGKKAGENLKKLLEENPPYNSTINCKIVSVGNGFDANENPEFFTKSIDQSSLNYFNKSSRSLCDGGSIPLMTVLQEKYPNVYFLVSGILGPFSNAHGPNEMLVLDYTERFICCVTQIMADTSAFYSKKE